MQKMLTQAQRVGILKGEILAHADAKEVLGMTGQQKRMPKNVGQTVKFRRWLPFGGVDNKWITTTNVASFAGSHLAAEGVTPTADTLTAVDVSATLSQYACLYALTDVVEDQYEDEIAPEMKKQTGQRIGLIREMVRYGTLKGMTNAYYAGGSSRGTVDATLTVNLIRKVTRNLKANHAEMATTILDASPKFGTSSVEASYLVFCHTDMEAAIRDLPGFIHTADYGNRQVIHPLEIGSVESFRFILSPELAAYADSGAAVGATGLYSTTGANIDVYPVLVCGEDAWGQVALRGDKALQVSYIKPGTIDTADPLGQRGYIGAKTYFTALMLNQGWAALIECGTPSLD
jgi:N4-gp56 family major capsid protein